MFQLPDDYVGLYEPTAGLLLPERVVAAYAEGAMRMGAELHGHEAVTGWSADDRGVTVTTDRATYTARHLVFTSGAWTDKIVRDLGVKLTVTRQILGWTWPREPDLFALGKFPVWAIEHADQTAHYGFPMLPDNPGLKVAHHWHDRPCDPATVNRNPELGDENDFLPALRRHLPAGDGPILATRICLYTNSPDSHFIVDHHPRHANVSLACGFSGHGFKFVSVMGEVLADLAMNGTTQWPIGFLSLRRFHG
jgi:sarcosine oxidase